MLLLKLKWEETCWLSSVCSKLFCQTMLLITYLKGMQGHGSSFRRLALIGSDGSQRHFIVQTSLTPNARSDERMLQLFRVLNKMFDKHKESRRRHLAIHTPIIIPVWSQVKYLFFYSLTDNNLLVLFGLFFN